MIIDTHIHSEFSFDSKMKIEELLTRRKYLNIGTCLTEHLDLDLANIPVLNIDDYLETCKKYKNNTFLVGIELGLDKSTIESLSKFHQKYGNKLDFIIGSIHSLYGEDLFFYLKQNNLSKKIIFKDYFEKMLFCVENFDYFDTLAHIDYICRYSNFDDNEIYFDEYKDLLSKIFKILIQKDKSLELNTRRLNNLAAYNTMYRLLLEYKKLGGKYVTLGSDSHDSNSIGNNFDIATKLLKEIELTPVYYKNRQRLIYSIY
ncbi:MAG: histidinol-phosphatase HisJ family protein [Sarcina sp.]